MSIPSIDFAPLSGLERQGVYSLRCLHQLANDMTCVVTSFALLEHELESKHLRATTLTPAQRSVKNLGATLRTFGNLRRYTSIPLETKSMAEVAEVIAGAAQPFEGWEFVPGADRSVTVNVDLRLLHCILLEALHLLKKCSGRVELKVAPNTLGLLTPLDSSNPILYLTILLTTAAPHGVLFSEGDESNGQTQAQVVIWKELLNLMKGWMQLRTRDDLFDILFVLPCEAAPHPEP